MRDRRFWELTWTLAVTDWRLRFYGSALGYLWTLARPFAFFGVIYIVFTEVAKIGNDVKDYGICILFSMVLFQFFGEATNGSVTAVVRRENLLRKMRFPRLVIPTVVVLSSLFELGLTLCAVLVFLLISGIWPTWGWLELIPLAALLTVFASGLGLLFSVLYVRFRDVSPIWDVLGQILFYISPILYVASTVPDEWRELYMLNPIACILTQMRHALIDSNAPTAIDEIGGWAIVFPLLLVVATFAIGLWTFIREAPKVAENL